ncbi:MAG: tetratricopeptide repeat protein [Dysgonamonadaceae bacterium]|jgi:tetratricopeptide (TPR) repeat protein|nr:tetratricopeptide repeat protein [Dysgonamonadaceae bacterium]
MSQQNINILEEKALKQALVRFSQEYGKNELNANYHPMQDGAVLDRFNDGTFTDNERKSIIKHLSECPDCRADFKELRKIGALGTETADVRRQIAVSGKALNPFVKQQKNFAKMILTLAALLLVCVCGYFVFYKTGNSREMAHNPVNPVKEKFTQKEQKLSLRLTDNGYNLKGVSVIKSFPEPMSGHQKEICSDYEKLLAKEPNNVFYKTEYAKYLLCEVKNAKAAVAVLSREPVTMLPEILHLLGLAAFIDRNDELAKEYLQQALKLSPKDSDIKLNTAIVLYSCGKEEEALKLFRELKKENLPDNVRRQIDTMLKND